MQHSPMQALLSCCKKCVMIANFVIGIDALCMHKTTSFRHKTLQIDAEHTSMHGGLSVIQGSLLL